MLVSSADSSLLFGLGYFLPYHRNAPPMIDSLFSLPCTGGAYHVSVHSFFDFSSLTGKALRVDAKGVSEVLFREQGNNQPYTRGGNFGQMVDRIGVFR